MPLPIEIVGLGKSEVRFVWEDERETVYSARELRLRCRCAHCVEEMTGQALLDPGSIPADLTVKAMELAGTYGVRIEFSDGHGTGIYRFQDLV